MLCFLHASTEKEGVSRMEARGSFVAGSQAGSLFYMGQGPQPGIEIPLVPGNPYLNRTQRARRGCFPRPGCLVTLAILLVLAIGSYTTFAHSWPIFGPTSITVAAHPTLVIESQRYEEVDQPAIRVHAGSDAHTMIFQVMSPGNISLPWNFGISNIQQNSDSSVIVLGDDPVYGRTFDVTVPADTDVRIYSDSASINLSGLTGQVDVNSNNASITLTDCHVQGTSLLHSNSGAITVTQSTLAGSVALSNNDGPITFNSAIDSTGSYVFENNQGSISVTLPQSASFHVDAKTNGGSISTNYAAIHVQNNEAHASVGNAPQAVVTLTTNNGTITLNKGA